MLKAQGEGLIDEDFRVLPLMSDEKLRQCSIDLERDRIGGVSEDGHE